MVATGFLLTAFFERREVMTFIESCIYYKDSICVLKDGCCDLNCDMADTDKVDRFYDEIDPFTKWQIEKARKEKNSESKLG
jgi:hypothetical protein